jgi:hypothetical protein
MDHPELRDPMVGKTLGSCLIEERVGRGGMGTVYRALHQDEGRRVALKILAPFLASEPAVVARFLREARSASRIHHPNVVRMWAAAQEGGLHYTIMDYVDGGNLAELLRRERRLAPGRAAFIALEVAKGLAALHAEGIVHRDVKPANILIGRDGAIKVTDFGIAWDASDLQRLTATGDLLGTIGFAAPEQLQQSGVDDRADLYSLGATLHFMMTGVRPPLDPRLPLAPLDSDVPKPLRELVEQLLARAPGDRPQDAASVVSRLAPHADATSAVVPPPLRRTLGRIAATAGGVGLAYVAGAVASMSRGAAFHADPWTLVLPSPEALLLTVLLFGAGLLLAFAVQFRGRSRVDVGLRSLLGLGFLAASLVVAYFAGAAMGTLKIWEAADALMSRDPDALLPGALALAALGLYVGMKKSAALWHRAIGALLVLVAFAAAEVASSPGPLNQALHDLTSAMSRGIGVWISFGLVLAGVGLASRHRGSLARLLLAPLAVFVSVGLIYWSSQGAGATPLRDVLSGPEGALSLAILLVLEAKVLLDLHPRPTGRDPESTRVTPTPSA